jgi:DNA-binding CsgD family transcriptional regulator
MSYRKYIQGALGSLILIGTAAVFWFSGKSESVFSNNPSARSGVFDARGEDFEHGGLPLSGEWLFTPDRFSEPGTGDIGGSVPAPGIVIAPGSWNGKNGAGLPGPYGRGTYELIVLTDGSGPDLSLYVPDQAISFRCYVDGELKGENGRPGLSSEDTLVVREGFLIPLSKDPVHHLLFHVANYHYNVGGLINPVVLGPSKSLALLKDLEITFSGILLGALAVVFLYFLLQYYRHRYFRDALYFSLFCGLVFLRVLTVSHFPERLFPNFAAFAISSRIEFISYYVGLPVYLLFIGELYPLRHAGPVLKSASALASAFSLAALLLPIPLFMAYTLPPYHLLTLAAGIYVFVNLLEAAARKRKGAVAILGGFGIFFLFILNDILHANLIIRSAHLSPLGLLFFVAAHFSEVIARHGRASFKDDHRASADVPAADAGAAMGKPAESPSGQALTKRENEIFRLLLEGFSDKEIASTLGVSPRTVSNTLGKLYRKSGVSNRLELVRILRPL